MGAERCFHSECASGLIATRLAFDDCHDGVSQARMRERANKEAPLRIEARLIVQKPGFQGAFHLLNVHLDAPRVDDIVYPSEPPKRAVRLQLDEIVSLQGLPPGQCRGNRETAAGVYSHTHLVKGDKAVTALGAIEAAQGDVTDGLRHAI